MGPDSKESEQANKNYALAAYYAISAGILGWVAGCMVVLLLIGAWPLAVGIFIRMFCYHIEYFYLYLAIISVLYSIFLYLWLLYHPHSRKLYILFSILGPILLISAASLPCGMLYQLHDMLAGFYPQNIAGKLWGDPLNYLVVGWMVVLLSVPLNILAAIGFYTVNHHCVKRYEKGEEPPFFRKLSKWNAEHPNRLFFAVGVLLFILVIACCAGHIDYVDTTSKIHIPRWRLHDWFFAGILLPAAPFLTLCCWLFKFIDRKLAWGLLFAGSFSLVVLFTWKALPQNVFIRMLGPSYRTGMRLIRLSQTGSFRDGRTTTGRFHCYWSRDDGTIAADASGLKITPLGNSIYSFERKNRQGPR